MPIQLSIGSLTAAALENIVIIDRLNRANGTTPMLSAGRVGGNTVQSYQESKTVTYISAAHPEGSWKS